MPPALGVACRRALWVSTAHISYQKLRRRISERPAPCAIIGVCEYVLDHPHLMVPPAYGYNVTVSGPEPAVRIATAPVPAGVPFRQPHLPPDSCVRAKPAQKMTVLSAHRQCEDFNLMVREAFEHPASHLAALNFAQACRLDIAPGEMSPQSFSEMLRRRVSVVARHVAAMPLRTPAAAIAGQPTTVSRDDDVIPIVPAGSHIQVLQHTSQGSPRVIHMKTKP